ncbi:MAG: hypothetical protein FWE60_02050 [Oscillospiraceae bacterium]|jgi:predicted RNA-binding Zn-ribbon protein involved in translation (DUF1610 family)|nr:hypothetical protein [Oscillospiraceae bacterium]
MTLFAKCTLCGENVHIDLTQKNIICPHCITPFVFERTAFNREMSVEALAINSEIEEKNEILSFLGDKVSKLNTKKAETERIIKRNRVCFRLTVFAFAVSVAVLLFLLFTGLFDSLFTIFSGVAPPMAILGALIFQADGLKRLTDEMKEITDEIRVRKGIAEKIEAEKQELMKGSV